MSHIPSFFDISFLRDLAPGVLITIKDLKNIHQALPFSIQSLRSPHNGSSNGRLLEDPHFWAGKIVEAYGQVQTKMPPKYSRDMEGLSKLYKSKRRLDWITDVESISGQNWQALMFFVQMIVHYIADNHGIRKPKDVISQYALKWSEHSTDVPRMVSTVKNADHPEVMIVMINMFCLKTACYIKDKPDPNLSLQEADSLETTKDFIKRLMETVLFQLKTDEQ